MPQDGILDQLMYWNITNKERLLQALEFAGHNRELLETLLADLLTEQEIKQCETRLEAACLLYDGASYQQIRSLTHLGPSTIARLSKSLSRKDSGFSKIIKKFASKGKPYFD